MLPTCHSNSNLNPNNRNEEKSNNSTSSTPQLAHRRFIDEMEGGTVDFILHPTHLSSHHFFSSVVIKIKGGERIEGRGSHGDLKKKLVEIRCVLCRIHRGIEGELVWLKEEHHLLLLQLYINIEEINPFHPSFSSF